MMIYIFKVYLFYLPLTEKVFIHQITNLSLERHGQNLSTPRLPSLPVDPELSATSKPPPGLFSVTMWFGPAPSHTHLEIS